MTFHPAPDDIANGLYRRQVSENGVWEIATHPVMFGTRVRAGIIGEPCCAVDYCAGADTVFQFELYDTIKRILEKLPETATEGDVCRMMPRYETKPINKDPCWAKLQEMAA